MSPSEENAALVELIRWIDESLANLQLSADERSMLAIGCFDVALETQAAIATLFTSQLYAPMFALLRVLTEALVRGLWLQHCATESQLSKFKRGKIDLEFGELISQVESQIGSTVPTLSNLKANAWTALNGFTHTGFVQVSRRHSPGEVRANYPDGELKQSQSLSGALGLVAAGQLVAMSGSQQLLEAMMERMKAYAQRGI
jgi:hypothetical protein